MKNDLFQQIFKFGIVGGIATVIDLGIYALLVTVPEELAKTIEYIPIIDPLIGNVIAFSISVIYNYKASVKWVFHVNEEKSKKKMFVEFMIFSTIGLLLTTLLLWVGINILGQNKILVKIVATAIVMVFNFITRKLFLE